MNEKIKQLAELARVDNLVFDQDLFAKLIIEEVMKIMTDSKNYNTCVHTTYDLDRAKCIIQELSKKIYEEFL